MSDAFIGNKKQTRGSYKKRHIAQPPRILSYKPAGIPRRNLEQIRLTVDEYEAFRLADFKNLDQEHAALCMQVSRPTFARILGNARHKIASALVLGEEILISGGNVDYAEYIHRCLECGKEHLVPAQHTPGNCPDCGSGNIENLASELLVSGNDKKRRFQ